MKARLRLAMSVAWQSVQTAARFGTPVFANRMPRFHANAPAKLLNFPALIGIRKPISSKHKDFSNDRCQEQSVWCASDVGHARR